MRLGPGPADRTVASMRSVPEFLLVALVVTLTPGPATATVLRVTARDGRAAAYRAVLGNSGGVLLWGLLSAVGVSSLILASQLAYDALKIGGAAVLIYLGLRSLLRRRQGEDEREKPAGGRSRRPAGFRSGLVTGASNPKLAVFFVSLFPQFLTPGTAVLPAALAMAATIVAIDVAWFSVLIYLTDRASVLLRPGVRRVMERITGGVMVALGLRLATEVR
jgi:threonine/homoserine/homoserine lactone efflux protein